MNKKVFFQPCMEMWMLGSCSFSGSCKPCDHADVMNGAIGAKNKVKVPNAQC